MGCDKVKAFADTGQHSKRQNIDLENAQSINIILVPLDHSAIFHRGVFDRTELIKPPLGNDEATNMLGQMAWKTNHFTN